MNRKTIVITSKSREGNSALALPHWACYGYSEKFAEAATMLKSKIGETWRSARLASGLVIVLATYISAQQGIPEYNDPKQPPPITTSSVPAPAVAATRKLTYELDVPGSGQWAETGIELAAGDRLVIAASGSLQNSTSQTAGPEGRARGWRDLLRALPVNGAGGGALIGRVGDSASAVPFLIGASKEITVNRAGRLFLGINQLSDEKSEGSFHVSLKIIPSQKPETNAIAELAWPPRLLKQLPRRVVDAQGSPGDLVNFVLIGSEASLKTAFQEAGWVQVDRTRSEAILHALISSTSKQNYVEMPMSELYLYGRAQDFGFARAEPISVVQSRHHLRVWKAPFNYQGQTVWAGAATHDVGFERDQRTGGVTHKIDPKVDLEREFVGSCFDEAGLLSGKTYALPSDALKEAHTATGGLIESDGRVLIMMLAPRSQ